MSGFGGKADVPDPAPGRPEIAKTRHSGPFQLRWIPLPRAANLPPEGEWDGTQAGRYSSR